MKIFVFGIGQFFHNRKNQFFEISSGDILIGFLDNCANEIEELDGVPVFSPSVVSGMQFDCIVLMSTYYQEICEQLASLGVPREKIFFWEQYRAEKTGEEIYGYIGRKEKDGKSILFVTTDLGYNGGSIAIVCAAQALMSRGYFVYLASPSSDDRILQEIREYGIHVVLIPSLPFISEKIKEWIQKFELIIVNVFQMIKAACDISQYRPVVWWIHECNMDSIYEYIRYQYSSYDTVQLMEKIGIYAVSDIARKVFEEYYPHQVFGLLPYGIPDESSYEKSSNITTEKYIFVIIGTVSRRKSQLIFLKAASMLPEKIRENCEFWVVGFCGQDSYGKQVRKFIQSFSRAKLFGVMNRSELRKLFQQIDCVVCASLEETMSLTITEGMMHGKVCITTDRTGMAEYIEDGVNGFICKAGEAMSLYHCMRRVFELRDDSYEIRRSARTLYKEMFSMDRFGERLEQALQETKRRYYQKI